MEQVRWSGRRERRREARYITQIECRLLWEGVNQPVTIRDISHYGALVNGRYLPPVGTRATLIAEGLETTGTIIWLGVDQCGILLSRMIEPLSVIRERPVRIRSGPRPDWIAA